MAYFGASIVARAGTGVLRRAMVVAAGAMQVRCRRRMVKVREGRVAFMTLRE